MVSQAREVFVAEHLKVSHGCRDLEKMENSCSCLRNVCAREQHLIIVGDNSGVNSEQVKPYCPSPTEESISKILEMEEKDRKDGCIVEKQSLEHTVRILRAQIAQLKRRNRNPCLKFLYDSTKVKSFTNYVKRLKVNNINLRKQVAALSGKQNVIVNDREVLKKRVSNLNAEVKTLQSKLNVCESNLRSMHGELEDKNKYIYVLNSKTSKVNNMLDVLRDEMDIQRKDFIVEELQLQMLKGRMRHFVNQIKQKIVEVLRLKAKYRSKLITLSNEKRQVGMMMQKVGRRLRRITEELKKDC